MAEQFDVTDLVKIGIEDERSGVAFYTALASRSRNPALKQTFKELAGQEKVHQARFEEILADLGGGKSHESYTGEYAAYLGVLTGSRAFTDPDTARGLAAGCRDDAAALDLAIRFERDTLLLMSELAGLLADKDLAIVHELAVEEQNHLVALTQAKHKL